MPYYLIRHGREPAACFDLQRGDDDQRALELPTAAGSFSMVELSANSKEHAAWLLPVRTYFDLEGGAWKLVGLDRMPDRSSDVAVQRGDRPMITEQLLPFLKAEVITRNLVSWAIQSVLPSRPVW